MEENVYRILVYAEGIHRLMEELVALQHEHHKCCRAVELPPDLLRSEKPRASPASLGIPLGTAADAVAVSAIDPAGITPQPQAPRLIPAPDPMAGQPDMVLAIGLAADKLGRSDRQLRRYRESGKLDFVDDDGEGRSGYWLSQVRRLYFDFYGKWPNH